MIINDLQQEKKLSEYNSSTDIKKLIIEQEITNTRQILKDTAEKIKITEIKASLLLMAFNLDILENLNKLNFENDL